MKIIECGIDSLFALIRFHWFDLSTALRIMTPEQLQAWRWEKEIDERNRPWSDEELDAMFPEGYKVREWFENKTDI